MIYFTISLLSVKSRLKTKLNFDLYILSGWPLKKGKNNGDHQFIPASLYQICMYKFALCVHNNQGPEILNTFTT